MFDKNYEILIQPNQIVDLDLLFSPTEVATYEFDIPMFVNKRLDNKYDDETRSPSPYQSDYDASLVEKTPVTRKSSRHSLVNLVPKRKITAIGLRPAIHLSEPKIVFKIPITYFENLKEGGFYEARVNKFQLNFKNFMT